MVVDRSKLLSLDELTSEIPEESDHAWVKALAETTVAQLQTAHWCPKVIATYYGGGIPGIIGLLYV